MGSPARGIGIDPDLMMRVDLSEAGGVTLADRLLALRPMPTAILLINELLAIGLYRRLGQFDLCVQPNLRTGLRNRTKSGGWTMFRGRVIAT